MTSREFFYAVANMRNLQRRYFASREQRVLMACRAAENAIDKEIARVNDILYRQENYGQETNQYQD